MERNPISDGSIAGESPFFDAKKGEEGLQGGKKGAKRGGVAHGQGKEAGSWIINMKNILKIPKR